MWVLYGAAGGGKNELAAKSLLLSYDRAESWMLLTGIPILRVFSTVQ